MSLTETHPSASPRREEVGIDRDGQLAITFQRAVLKALGLTSETAGPWIVENAVRLRKILDTDEKLRAFLAANQWDEAVEYAGSQFVH